MQRGVNWTLEETSAGATDVRLEGRVCEYARFEQLLDDLPAAGGLVLDLAGIERINSIGVRQWIEFIEQCRARFSSLRFDRCSVVFVSQVNTVAGFAHSREIHSVYAPYVCEQCGAEKELLVDVSRSMLVDLAPPKCEHDGETMVFDDLEEVYFGFLRRP